MMQFCNSGGDDETQCCMVDENFGLNEYWNTKASKNYRDARKLRLNYHDNKFSADTPRDKKNEREKLSLSQQKRRRAEGEHKHKNVSQPERPHVYYEENEKKIVRKKLSYRPEHPYS